MTRTQTYYLSRTVFYIVLAIIFVYIVFPFYWAFRSSITPDGELFVTPVHYWPVAPTLAHYQQVLGDGQFITALGNSAIVASASTLLSLFLGDGGGVRPGAFQVQGPPASHVPHPVDDDVPFHRHPRLSL